MYQVFLFMYLTMVPTLMVSKIVVYLKFGEEIRLFVSSMYIYALDDDAFSLPRIIYICQQ